MVRGRIRGRVCRGTETWLLGTAPRNRNVTAEAAHRTISGKQSHARLSRIPRRPRKLHEAYYEIEDGALRHNEGLNNEDVLPLEEFLAAAEGDMTMADRTWAAARQLLDDIQRARDFCPVVQPPFRWAKVSQKADVGRGREHAGP